MPTPPPPIDYASLAAKHGGSSAQIQKVDYSSLAKKHNGVSMENPGARFPAELDRVKDAIGVNIIQGKPFNAYGGKTVASVKIHEPHTVEINNRAIFDKAPIATLGHEIVHLWQNNLPPVMQREMPPDNPKDPYYINDLNQLRKEGKTLRNLPPEKAARVVELWIANPNVELRAHLQPWIDDLNTTPLSAIEATSPDQKGINTHPRPPMVPIEAYK